MSFFGGLAVTLAANAGISLGTLFLFRPSRTGERGMDLVWYGVLRFGLMSAVVLVLGSCGVLRWWSLLAVSAVLGGGAALFCRAELAGAWRAVTELHAAARAWWAGADLSMRTTASIAIALGALLALRTLFAIWFFAPYGGDETYFQLPKLASWIQSGTLDRPALPDVRGFAPSGFQLLEVWWVLFLHHDVLIEVAGVEFLVFVGVVVAVIGRRLGLSRPRAALAGLLFCGLPLTAAGSTSCSNGIALTAMVLAAFAFALRDGPWVRDAGAIFGISLLGLSFSPLFVCVAPALIGVTAARGRSSPDTRGPSVLRVVALLLLAAVGLFWYLRNGLDFGNAFYPIGDWSPLSTRAAYQMAPRLDSQELNATMLESLRLNTGDFVNTRLYDAYVPFSHLTFRQAGWGWYGMAIGLPALLVAIRRRLIPGRLSLGMAAGTAVLFTTMQPDLWNMRHIGWLAALPCLGIAAVLPQLDPLPRRAMAYLVALAFALNLFGVAVADGVGPREMRRSIDASWRSRSGRDLIRDHAVSHGDPEGGPVCFVGIIYPVYTLYRPDYSATVVPLRFGTIEDVETQMRARGSKYLVVGRLWRSERAALAARIVDGTFEVVEERTLRLRDAR